MIEIKYLRPELLEAIARNTLKKYDEGLVSGYEAKEVPIEEIIESMGLSLEYQYIRNNGRILGETVFDDSYVPIYNMDEHRYELIFVERGTIILDASLLRCRTRGRHRFTAAHELAHWLIHQELYSGTGDTAAMLKHLKKSSDADRRIEQQADILASALLLPISQVKKAFYRTSGEDRVSQLATQFGVSNQAMEIRLCNHHLI